MFKIGDIVKLNKYIPNHEMFQNVKMRVIKVDGCTISCEDGFTPQYSLFAFNKDDLELVKEGKEMFEFKIGDKVRLKNQNAYGGLWKEKMKVVDIYDQSSISCDNGGIRGCFYNYELELVKREAVPLNKEESYYIMHDDELISDSYKTIEECIRHIKAASEHNEEFEIVKVIKKVKVKQRVETDLEIEDL